jgi:dTDP-4-amino-4,6-dideoxygalactose transaminase
MISIAQPQLEDDERDALIKVLDSKILVQGPNVEKFEHAFADYIGTRFGIATSSGTTALAISLMAMNIRSGDEVITTPFTFIATASAIRLCGAVPVFVDIDPDTFNIEPKLIKAAITPKTKAIMPVHLYGLSAEMKELRVIAQAHDLFLIEDACQAHGAKYGDSRVGGIGDIGCFSFYPTKNMTTGEGGMIVTNSEELANKSRLIRNHGQESRYCYVSWGCNFRMTEFAGALGIVQLSKLDKFNEKRRKNALKLNELLGNEVETPKVPSNMTHVFHQYTIKLPSENSRDGLKKYLNEKGIGTEIYYPLGLNKIDFLAGRSVGSLENTEHLTRTILSLPVHPGLSDDDLELIAREVLAGLHK